MVSKRTHRKHQQAWNSSTATINNLLNSGEDPEHYFKRIASLFDTDTFLSKGRKGLNIGNLYMSVGADLQFIATRWCEKAQRYMMANHKWKNRTGDAEMGVDASVAGIENDRLEIYLYHSVYYGKYLETVDFSKAGYLGIIPETIQTVAPQITADLQDLLDRV